MPTDHRYESALKAALAIIHDFDRPEMARQEKLARVTYAVLDAIYRADGLPSPPLPGRVTASVRVLPATPRRLTGGSHERSKLAAPR